jgi:hypothetical protein
MVVINFKVLKSDTFGEYINSDMTNKLGRKRSAVSTAILDLYMYKQMFALLKACSSYEIARHVK